MKNIFFAALVAIGLAGCDIGTSSAGEDPSTASADTVQNHSCTGYDNIIAEKVSKLYLLQTIDGQTEEEAREWMEMEVNQALPVQGLTSFDIDTIYNRSCILGIAYRVELVGAYPTSFTGYLNYNRRTGDTLFLTDFVPDIKIDDLIAKCNVLLQQNIAATRNEIPEEEREGFDYAMNQREHAFNRENISNFYLVNAGVVFRYEFDFPHPIQGLEPDGDILLPIAELKPYLAKDGMLFFWAG